MCVEVSGTTLRSQLAPSAFIGVLRIELRSSRLHSKHVSSVLLGPTVSLFYVEKCMCDFTIGSDQPLVADITLQVLRS